MKKIPATISLLLASLILFPCSNLLQAETFSIAGTITSDTSWTADTVNITGHLTVQSGATLTIAAGTRVEFQGHYSITVNGAIKAVGAPNDTILFTINDPSSFDLNLDNPTGSWSGIKFRNSPDTSWFSYCKFQYSKAVGAEWPDNSGGVMSTRYGNTGPLILSNSHFHHNYCSYRGGAVIYEGTSHAVVENCKFTENQASSGGAALYCWNVKLACNGSYFAHNQSDDGYGGAIGFGNDCNLNFTRNTFHDNSARGGGVMNGYGSILKLTNNIMANNQATLDGGALRLNENPYPVLTGNIIVNNESGNNGGGLYLSLTDAILVNNTIANNAATTGGAGYFHNSIPEIHNSIMYGNQPEQLHIGTGISSPDIFHSNLQGGSAGITGYTYTGTYQDNIDVLPGFSAPTVAAGTGFDGLAADWSLLKDSPCINGGASEAGHLDLPETDVYANERISNRIVDMGAAETYIGTITVSADITEDTYWIADTVKVGAGITIQDGFTLRINRGTVVEFQGEYGISVAGRLLAQGTRNDSILFTIIPALRNQGWKSIVFSNYDGSMYDNDTSRIDFCRLEYARSGHQGSIGTWYFSMIVISNSSFYESSHTVVGGGIINVQNAAPVILNNTFRNCSGTRVINSSYGRPLIIGNSFIDNDATAINGWMSNCTVRDNFISNNQYGVYARAGNTRNWIITNNIIVNNNSSGIYIFDGAQAIVQNNTVVNNGGDLYARDARLTVVNSVFNSSRSSISDESQVSIIHSNMIGGEEALNISGSAEVEFDHIFDSDPAFRNPTNSYGLGYYSEPEDWQLLSVSGCINNGSSEKAATPVSRTDFFGNPRINDGHIDIGAAENQSGIPVFTQQPLGAVMCSGNSLLLHVETNDTVIYQWQKDGINIEAATQSALMLEGLAPGHQGSYQCVITNAYGTVASYPANLIVHVRPEFIAEPELGWATPGQPLNLTTFARGSNLDFAWFRNDTLLAGEISPELVITHPGLPDEGSYFCVISNSCGADTSNLTNLFLAPQICMVTVDPESGHNLIVWEKESRAPIEAYNIYRESNYAGIYDFLATVPATEQSVFTDTTANPMIQAYLYKISGVDTSGFETDLELSITHKTIHLLATKNPETGVTQLDWDKYVGFEYGSYEIYRSINLDPFSMVHTMSSSTSTWADSYAFDDTLYYRIAAVKPDTCFPSGSKKETTGPYTHALSNLDDNKLQQSTGLGTEDFSNAVRIYPNPAEDRVNISFRNPPVPGTQVLLKDLAGRTLRSYHRGPHSHLVIDRQNLPAGMYVIEIKGPGILQSKLLFK